MQHFIHMFLSAQLAFLPLHLHTSMTTYRSIPHLAASKALCM